MHGKIGNDYDAYCMNRKDTVEKLPEFGTYIQQCSNTSVPTLSTYISGLQHLPRPGEAHC